MGSLKARFRELKVQQQESRSHVAPLCGA